MYAKALRRLYGIIIIKKRLMLKYLAIILLVLVFSYFSYIIVNICYYMIENNKLDVPTCSHIVMGYNFDQVYTRPHGSYNDIDIDLMILSPHGTLMAGDPVKISGRAILNSLQAKQRVKSLTMIFQNSQSYPVTQDLRGITIDANLHFIKNEKYTNQLDGNAINITWPLEGTYSPQMGLLLSNGSAIPVEFQDDTRIIVYSKSQLVQIWNNKAILLLAIPASFLAFFDLFRILYSLIKKN
jgi:hypothetical protein